MGYSARYHAASLAAVFLALAVGILVGVGFGSDIVSGTADDLEASLQSDIEAKNEQIDELETQLADEREFSSAVAPAVVENRLRERQVAIVAFGELDDSLADDVRAALAPAGATLREIAVVREPPDANAVDEALPRRRGRNETRDEQLTRAAKLAGEALIRGGERFDALASGAVLALQRRPRRARRHRHRPPAARGSERARRRRLRPDRGRDDRGDAGRVRRSARNRARDHCRGREHEHRSELDRILRRPRRRQRRQRRSAFRQGGARLRLGGAEGEFGVKETADALLPDLLATPADDGRG